MKNNNTLQLQFIAANKEAVSEADLEAMIMRAFAHNFCGDDDEETTAAIIVGLAGCLCDCRLGKAVANDDKDQEEKIEKEILRGPDAEQFYCDEVVRLYMANGSDKLYAKEAASWPSWLALSAEYPKDILTKMAELEVGHDLILGAHMRAMALREQKQPRNKNGIAKQ